MILGLSRDRLCLILVGLLIFSQIIFTYRESFSLKSIRSKWYADELQEEENAIATTRNRNLSSTNEINENTIEKPTSGLKNRIVTKSGRESTPEAIPDTKE